jgi:hypothetical protein
MAKFRKKPVTVNAFQWFPNMGRQGGVEVDHDANNYYVVTAHGQRAYVAAGDWIITEPDGRGHYPCKPDIFAATYESAEG